MKLGVVTTGALGWRSIGQRWQKHLPQRIDGETFFLEVQDFEGVESLLPIARRHAWLRAALRGRRAAKEAIRRGADQILLCTIVDAPMLPRVKGIRYLIYGDATPRQLDELYYHDRSDSLRKRYLRRGITRLASDGHLFLCMSEWYRQSVVADYRVTNTAILPPFLDTDLWSPRPFRPDPLPLRALFVGGDFERKGGEVVLDLANRFSSSEVQWHIVTSEAARVKYGGRTDRRRADDARGQAGQPAPTRGMHFYTDLGPDDPQLVALAQSCHLFVFPTRADCSPLAVLEAGAVGMPVLTTNVGGLNDMVQDGLNGALVEPNAIAFADAIKGYLGDTCRLTKEGESARQRVVERNSIGQHLDVLTSALNG